MTPTYERILVPTDGSTCAELAADHAVSVAERYGSTVHVVSVVNLIEKGGYFSAGGVSEEFVERLDSEAEAFVDRITEKADRAGLETETEIRHGIPSTEIVEYATDRDIDLIVMGTHGRTSVARYLMGSVAERVVRTSPVPVLTVRETTGEGATGQSQ